jgi:hypothetical protein
VCFYVFLWFSLLRFLCAEPVVVAGGAAVDFPGTAFDVPAGGGVMIIVPAGGVTFIVLAGGDLSTVVPGCRATFVVPAGGVTFVVYRPAVQCSLYQLAE